MRSIDELLVEHPFFAGFDEETARLVAGCAINVHVAAGRHLFREGESADHFYLVRHGRVALEVYSPGREPLVVDTADAGDVVGWSWLIPPYRWLFDARAVTSTSAVRLDAECLRRKCAEDPRLGYLLMQRVSQGLYHRLQAARVRLLDLYGNPKPDRFPSPVTTSGPNHGHDPEG